MILIIYLAKQMAFDTDSSRQAGAEIAEYFGRGVYVPEGLAAWQIMQAAEVLERDFEVEPYTSRSIARAVLLATRQETERVVAPAKAPLTKRELEDDKAPATKKARRRGAN